jgi:crotonobetainyl-CoA:carnitine CoA-transferase CaiB-like acyl-CoA transferase
VLSDLGAQLVKVEPPGGHHSRQWLPSRGDGASALFAYLSTGKSSIVVDEASGPAEALLRLVSSADALITDRHPRQLAELGEIPQSVVVASILPFGASGPYSSHAAHHLSVFHSGGEGSILPGGKLTVLFPDRPPVQLGSNIAWYDAGWNAAVAVLAAWYDLSRSGSGQRIDVSVQESELTLNRTRMSRFHNDGVLLNRGDDRYRGAVAGAMRCRDGWMQVVGIRDEHWDRLLAVNEGSELSDERFSTPEGRAIHLSDLRAAFERWCSARAKADVVSLLSRIGVPAGIFAVPSDLISSEQLAHRGFLRRVDDPACGQLVLPGPPYRFSKTPVKTMPAPELDSFEGFGPAPLTRTANAGSRRLLDGIRVLDFTWAAAGPYATLLLSLLGAEVIKVETRRRVDPARRGFLADYGGTENSPNFNELNLNKLSLEVDLTEVEGLDLVRQLLSHVDVVVDNFRPGVMKRFGLGPDDLLGQFPGLVVASSSANGSTGPDAPAAGLASIFAATGGLSEQTGYPDGPPVEVGDSTDFRSGAAFAVGILAALLHRAATGEGQHVDLASREVVIASAPDALLAHAIGVPWPLRRGNGHPVLCPHDVYPCAVSDDWMAIAVGSEQEWSGLCAVLGREDWTGLVLSERSAMSEAIDKEIHAWTATRSSEEAFAELQAAGVPASPVMTFEALAHDPHLAARQAFVGVDHPVLGPQKVMRSPWLFSRAECPIIRHGPLMGQDYERVRRIASGGALP